MKYTNHLICTAPSNIALVKYWGKFGKQLPCNPSISFSLKHSITKMELLLLKKQGKNQTHQFLFSGKKNDQFSHKILSYLEEMKSSFSFLNNYILHIDSSNTFPHSAGIASSASSMAALSYGLCIIEASFDDTKVEQDFSKNDFLQKASSFARLGSGSACRSLYGGVSTWGIGKSIFSNNEYAAPFIQYDPVFQNYCDSVLLVDSNEKSVSSRAGHALMIEHPFNQVRYENANENLEQILIAMKAGDCHAFGEVVEREALELHGLMMNSTPSFILMKPNTLNIISKIRSFRSKTDIPLYFTLDAGPNPHLLYPKRDYDSVQTFIKNELLEFCEDNRYINDEIGTGPTYKFI